MSAHDSKRFLWQALSLWVAVLVLLFLLGMLEERISKLTSLFEIFEELILFGLMIFINHLLIHQRVTWKPYISSFHALIFGIPVYLFAICIGYTITQQFHLDLNWPLILVLSLSTAAFEEYLFRGLLLGIFLKVFATHSKKRQIWSSVVASSLLFGLAHGLSLSNRPLTATTIQIFAAAAGGFFYSAVYLRSGSIIMPMLLHGLWDFILLLKFNATLTTPRQTVSAETIIIDGILAMVTILISIFYLRRKQLTAIQLNRLMNC